MRLVYVIDNRDPDRVSPQPLEDAVAANHLQQTYDYAPAWNRQPAAVVAKDSLEDAAIVAGDDLLRIPAVLRPFDSSQDPDGAVAYHWVDSATGKPAIVVLTDKVADDVIPLLISFLDALSSALGHEIIETGEDLFAEDWTDMGNGKEKAHESVDQVQSSSYAKTVTRKDGSTTSVQVTNFNLPASFGPGGEGEKYDYLGLLKGPHDVLPDQGDGRGGGYMIVRQAGAETSEILGDKKKARCYSWHTIDHRKAT